MLVVALSSKSSSVTKGKQKNGYLLISTKYIILSKSMGVQDLWGVQQNYAEALIWYRKAAVQGYVTAQYNLGWIHENSPGEEQDYAKALTWYRKAADQGDATAQRSLGWMHQKGLGVKQNYAEALTWYRRAADQGDALAQCRLGWMHRNGLGGEQ